MSESEELKQKAVSGVVWSAVQKYSLMFINFVSDIILARLLTPYDFGCVGMLTIFMVLAETFVDGGFGSALIQKKRPTQEDYSTVFYWNMGMSLILYAILFFSAPAISHFYKTPLLCSVLRIQGLILFVYAFNIIQTNQLKKKLDFKAISIVAVITSIVSFVVTVLMAYKGLGVWALVAKNLIASALTSIIFWFYIKWRPIFVFSWQSFKDLFSFGFYMFMTDIVTSISSQVQGLLIGRVYSPSTMGYYSKASSTEGMATRSVYQVLVQVTYPLYAEVQDDKKALQGIVKRITMCLSYLTFPLLFVLILVAKPLFVLLYSEKWIPAVPYFQVLCIAGLAHCLQAVTMQTISAIGKSKVTFVWTFVKRVLGICFIVGGLFIWGMKGLLFGVILNNWLSYFVNMGLVSKHIGYKWYRQLFDLLPVFIASIVAAVLSYFCGGMLHLNMYPDGIIKIFVFAVMYLGWSFIFKPKAFEYTKNILDIILSKFTKRKKSV